MTTFRIVGQRPLRGEITVSGSKNAATTILAATLLSRKPCTLKNVPRIEDVHRILELLESVGATVQWNGEHELTVQATNVDPTHLNFQTVRRLRSSILLMGALLGRAGSVRLPGPGGDQIGVRPLDAHFAAFRELGISLGDEEGTYRLAQGKRGTVALTMSEFSVTATENVILASVLAEGKRTKVLCAAAEPSIQDLCWFLQTLGAKISGIGTHTLTIEGVRELGGNDGYTIIPDPVETGTFLCLGAAARAELRIIGAAPDFFSAELQKFREANVSYELTNERSGPSDRYRLADIVTHRTTRLRAVRSVHNMPYPGFAADVLQPCAVMLTQANGTSLVHDWMYEGRLKYVEELNKMGADIFIADPHRILVNGPSNLFGATITSYDIRTGATLLIAALIAEGTSTIAPGYQVDRGYERLDERLRALGATIERQETP